MGLPGQGVGWEILDCSVRVKLELIGKQRDCGNLLVCFEVREELSCSMTAVGGEGEVLVKLTCMI